ncbi:MAG: thiamine diphosphokinase [Chitinophagales bacterium]
MNTLILCNGSYGSLDWYTNKAEAYDFIICVDGAAAVARKLALKPHVLIGDMDSILPADKAFMKNSGVKIVEYPSEKNETDTMLALLTAMDQGATEVTIWGGTGSRLDHTISNLYSVSTLTQKGIPVIFESPSETIHVINSALRLKGEPGDTVSLLVLSDLATGITLSGFKYPLNNATLELNWQWAVSNVIEVRDPLIELISGTLAVIHYHIPV